MQHCFYEGSKGRHGQNIYWHSGKATVEHAVLTWYNESKTPGYDYAKEGETQKGTGHFTQLVWRTSTCVGAAISPCGKYLVCNYYPAGNVAGRYETCVKAAAA